MLEHVLNVLHELKAGMLMVVVQMGFAAVNIFYKLAVNDGMDMRILVAYRFLFATAFIAPVALVLERKTRPKLTWTVLFQAFLCALFGATLAQNLYMEGLALTSATFASAIANLTPAITFVLAVAFRLEKLGLGTWSGKAKVFGTLIGIGGAMLLTFYKGPYINIWSAPVHLLHKHQNDTKSSHNNALGALYCIAFCLCFAFWLIIQAKMSKTYPCYYSSTALMSIMAAIQTTIFALCMEHDGAQWKLGWNIRLYSGAFVGIVGSGLVATLISWCVNLRGPLYVSSFSPLMLVFVAISASFLLEEKLRLGSILGGTVIVCGLYMVLWGKANEMKKMNQLVPSDDPEDIATSSKHDNSNSSNNNFIGIKDEETQEMNQLVSFQIQNTLDIVASSQHDNSSSIINIDSCSLPTSNDAEDSHLSTIQR